MDNDSSKRVNPKRMPQSQKSSIEDLKRTLYSRTEEPRQIRRGHFHDNEQGVRKNWDTESNGSVTENGGGEIIQDPWSPQGFQGQSINDVGFEKPKMSITTKILLASAAFFVAALGFGGYMLFRGANVVSSHNVDILVNGPVSISGGEVFDYSVRIVNNNNVELNTVDYVVEYPGGTVDPTNLNLELKGQRTILPNIAPGGKSERVEKAVMYGEEGEKKEVKIRVLYRVPNSSATYEKETSYSVLINSSPISMKVNSFSEINNGQEIEFTVDLASNSKETLKNLLLKADYPFGFVFTSSDPKPLIDNQTWQIGDIAPGSKKTIKLKGKIQGQDEEQRSFKFRLGLGAGKNDRTISAEFARVSREVKIKKPFVSLTLDLNGNSSGGDYPATFNQDLRGEIQWFNNITSAVEDVEIRLKFSGNAYDKTSVKANEGTFISGRDEIVWNQRNSKSLAKLGPGESGKLSFSFNPRDTTKGKGIVNPQVIIEASVKGNRPSESNVPETVSSAVSRTVKVSSSVSVAGQVVRTSGNFENTGPIPPVAEKATTYSVIWTAYNTSSNITGVKVESILPPYVKWLDQVYPSSEDVTYNQADGKIVWNVGNMRSAGSVGSNNRRQVEFRISFEPGINQVNQSPSLVGRTTLTATDDFSGVNLKAEQVELDTQFDSDPSYRNGDAIVKGPKN